VRADRLIALLLLLQSRGRMTASQVAAELEVSPATARRDLEALSMAGIPPTAGFAGKLYLFTAVVDQGGLWLAFVGFIMSMISVYYYLLVVKAMYLGEGPKEPVKVSGALRACVLVSVALTLALGVYPEPLANLTNFVAATFFGRTGRKQPCGLCRRAVLLGDVPFVHAVTHTVDSNAFPCYTLLQ